MIVRKNLSTDDIGQVGQKLVCMLASSVGATPNESGNDRMGWDVVLQFEVPDDTKGPLDRAPSQRTCWLQVKTTTAKRRSWAIKLTNWQKMVRDPSPWFVVVVHLDLNNQASSVHVVHVSERWTAMALKALRRASKKGAATANKIKPAISWSEAELLPEISGDALVAKINASIGADYDQYVRDKAERYKSLGYDGPRHSIRLSVRKTDDAFMSDMADIAVGLRRVMPGDWSATAHDIRFGIPHEIKKFDRASGDMKIDASAQGGLRLRVESGGPWPAVEVDCEVFRARNVFPFLPERFDKFRIASEHVSLLIPYSNSDGHQHRSFTASLPFNEPVPLKDVEGVVWIVLHLTDSSGATLTVSSEDGRSSVTQRRFESHSEEELGNFRFFESVTWVCRTFGLPDDTAVDLELAVRQRQHFEFMANTLRNPSGPVSIVSSRAQVPIGERIGVVGAVSAQTDDMVLFAIYGVHGVVTSSERIGESWRTDAQEISLTCDKHVVPVTEHDAFGLRDAIQEMRSKLGRLGLEHIFLDPAAFPQQANDPRG